MKNKKSIATQLILIVVVLVLVNLLSTKFFTTRSGHHNPKISWYMKIMNSRFAITMLMLPTMSVF